MCIRDSECLDVQGQVHQQLLAPVLGKEVDNTIERLVGIIAVSYTHLRAHETVLDLVCRLLLEKKK